MRLAYNGLPFHGWQRQPNAHSVQQAIEEAMATVLRLPQVAITGEIGRASCRERV